MTFSFYGCPTGPEMLVMPRTKTREVFTNMVRGDLPTPGAQVITPFQRADTGDIILVNRGFVPDEKRAPSTRVNGQLQGRVSIEGIVRLGEKSMCQEAGAKPILIDVAEEYTPTDGYPLGGQTQINIRNEHLQYIITWYSLSAATLLMWYAFRRNHGGGGRRLPPTRFPSPLPSQEAYPKSM
eukprot:gene8514-10253_t